MVNIRTLYYVIVLLLPFIGFSQVNANFIIDKKEGCGSLAVSFTDQSSATSGTIVDWKWNLGGTISSKQNPGIIFINPGEYTICLTVKSSTGATSTLCKDKIIKVYANPTANFTTDITQGCLPTTITFDDTSLTPNGPIASWTWDIGGSSNVINTTDPTRVISTTYTTAGDFTPTLSITDIKGCKHTTSIPNLIKIKSIPKVNIDYSFINSCDLPWRVKFTNLDADPSAIFTWDFGNGQSFVGADPPVIQYTEPKKYTISVIVDAGICKDTLIFTDYINTVRVTDFDVLSTSLCQGQSIQISDMSNYEADSLKWDFGDGSVSTDKNPVHSFSQPGCYVISLTKYINGCEQTITKPCIQILPSPVINYSFVNGFACTIPAKVTFQASSNTSGNFEWHLKSTSIDTLFISDSTSFTLNAFGVYDVDLLFTGDNGCIIDIDNEKLDISKLEAYLPSFGPKGCIPFTASMSDSIFSTSPIVQWNWEVGSPPIFTSSAKNPDFLVDKIGRWDVRLIVKNAYGCLDTIVKKEYIQGGTKPTVDFVGSPQVDCLSKERYFESLSSSNADFWIWSVNDSIFSLLENPSYAFPDTGTFNIKLQAFHNGCSDDITKFNYVTILLPKSSFDVAYRCDDPSTIDIRNLSIGADSLYWVVTLSPTVRDTILDSLLSSYTFPGRGTYFLSHYAKNFTTGCEHTIMDTIFIVDLKASYELDTLRGCSPLKIQLTSFIQDAKSYNFSSATGLISDTRILNPSFLYTVPGSHLPPSLTALDRHGCRDTFQLDSTIQVGKINASIFGPPGVCIPFEQIYIDSSSFGFGSIVERTWILGQDTSHDVSALFDFTSVGTYSLFLSLTDSWGCRDSVRKEITTIQLSPSYTSDTLSCSQRGVRFLPQNDPTYLTGYLWDFGDGTTSIEKNPLHYYINEGVFDVCVEMYDSRGCSKKVCDTNFIQIKNPIASFSGDPIEAPCPPLLSSFLNMSSNATSYLWDFGDRSGLSGSENPSHVYTSPGAFDITLFAELIPGCVDTLIKPGYVLLLGPNAEMKFEVIGNCVPLEINLIGSADKEYTFTWDYGDGQILTIPGMTKIDTSVYIYNQTGSYIPKLLVSDDQGCLRTFATDPIIVNNVNAQFDQLLAPVCGIPFDFFLENKTTSTENNIQYQWTLNGLVSTISNGINPSWKIEDYGIYSAILIAWVTNCVDTIRKDSVVEVAAIPNPSFDIISQLICQNVPLSISNTTTLDYGTIAQWNWRVNNDFSSNSENPNFILPNDGIYKITLIATSDKGCKDSITKDYTVLPNTKIILSEDKTICIGDSVNLSATIESSLNSFSYQWTKNDSIICADNCQTINVKPSVSTQYTIKTETANGCLNIDSVNVQVIQISGPSLVLSGDTIVCKNGMIEIGIDNFDPSFIYTWDINDEGLDCYVQCQKVNAAPKAETYYSVIVSNSFGCVKEDSILISIEESIPDFLVSGKSICQNATTALNVSGVVFTLWDGDPSLSCQSCDTSYVSPLTSRYYYVSVKSKVGCQYRDSIYVDLVPLNSIEAGLDTTICLGESYQLIGNAPGDIQWSSKPVAQFSTLQSLQTTIKPSATSYVVLSAQKGECMLTDTLLINVIKKTNIEAIGDSVCANEIAIASASGDADTYEWYKDNKRIGEGTQIELVINGTTDVYVVGTRGLCESDTVNVRLLTPPLIDYKILNKSVEIFYNSKADVKATYDADVGYIYQWTPSDGLSCQNCPEPTIQYIDKSGIFSVQITDEYGCQIIDQISVRYRDECDKNGFYIPNVFTPYNGDGKNDIFRIFVEDRAEFIGIGIYDRWGEQVFVSDDVDFVWDGIYGSRELEQGVYTYIITAKCDKTNELFSFGGDITLMK